MSRLSSQSSIAQLHTRQYCGLDVQLTRARAEQSIADLVMDKVRGQVAFAIREFKVALAAVDQGLAKRLNARSTACCTCVVYEQQRYN